MPTVQTISPAARSVPAAIAPADLLPANDDAERPVGRLAVELFFDEADEAAAEGLPATFKAEVPLSKAAFAGRLGSNSAGIVVGDGATHLHLVVYVSRDEDGGEAATEQNALAPSAGLLADAPLEAPARPVAEPDAVPAMRAPRERSRTPLPVWRLKRTLAYLEAHLSERVYLSDLAAAAGLTRMHFAAQFRIATGLSPHAYLLRRRIERAQELMRETSDSLVAIALDVGFQTQAHFTTVFKRHVGETPYRWRRAHAAPSTVHR